MTRTATDFRRTIGRFRDAVLACASLKPRDKVVALVMLGRVNRQMAEGTGQLLTWTGVETLADRTALCSRDVERARSALLAAGVIELDRPAGRRQPARFRFCLDWLDREDGPGEDADDPSPDSGVADRGVGQSSEGPTLFDAFADQSLPVLPTRESAEPCDRIPESAHEGARADHAHARPAETEKQLHDRIAACIGKVQHQNWFGACRILLSGDRALLVVAPSRYVADRIRQSYADDLIRPLQIRRVEVRVGPALPGKHDPLEIRGVAGSA